MNGQPFELSLVWRYLEQSAGNWIIWALLLLGLCCYLVLFNFVLRRHDPQWLARVNDWFVTLAIMLSALPLLGLLGTIKGLLDTFDQIARDGGLDQQMLLSGGIADALLTTQLGLVLVVPGLLLLAYLKYQHQRAGVQHAN